MKIRQFNWDTIGKRVRLARNNKKYTQKQLARIINSSQTYISQIEAGKHRLSFNTAVAIARALDVSVEWLLSDNSSSQALLQDILNSIRGMSPKQLELLLDNINAIKKLK